MNYLVGCATLAALARNRRRRARAACRRTAPDAISADAICTAPTSPASRTSASISPAPICATQICAAPSSSASTSRTADLRGANLRNSRLTGVDLRRRADRRGDLYRRRADRHRPSRRARRARRAPMRAAVGKMRGLRRARRRHRGVRPLRHRGRRGGSKRRACLADALYRGRTRRRRSRRAPIFAAPTFATPKSARKMTIGRAATPATDACTASICAAPTCTVRTFAAHSPARATRRGRCRPVDAATLRAAFALRSKRRDFAMSEASASSALGLAFAAALTARALSGYPRLTVAQATDPPLDPKAPASTWAQGDEFNASVEPGKVEAGQRADGGLHHDRRPCALRALRRDAARAGRRGAAYQRRGSGQRRRSLDRPLAQRHQRLLLPVLRDAQRHALRVLVGEHGLLAELGIGRDDDGKRLHRDDAHSIRGAAQRARRRLARAVRALRAGDRRTAGVVVRQSADVAGLLRKRRLRPRRVDRNS